MPGRTNVGKAFNLVIDPNNAVNLDGSLKHGKVLAYAALNALTDWTIEFWINDNGSNGAYPGIMGIRGATANKYAWINCDSGEGTFNCSAGYAGSDAYIGKTSQQMPTGSWAHIAITHNATTKAMAIFKNGINVGSDFSASGTGAYNALTALDFYFGIDQTASVQGMKAKYACTRIWNTVRTAAELLANMNYYLDPTQEGSSLVLNCNFNEGSGTTVANTVSGGNNMSLVNTPSWTTGPTLTAKNYNGPRVAAGARTAAGTRTLAA